MALQNIRGESSLHKEDILLDQEKLLYPLWLSETEEVTKLFVHT